MKELYAVVARKRARCVCFTNLAGLPGLGRISIDVITSSSRLLFIVDTQFDRCAGQPCCPPMPEEAHCLRSAWGVAPRSWRRGYCFALLLCKDLPVPSDLTRSINYDTLNYRWTPYVLSLPGVYTFASLHPQQQPSSAVCSL